MDLPDAWGVLPPGLTDTDESYSLAISADGGASIVANQYSGVMRGISSFAHLTKWSATNASYYVAFTPITIQDGPRYPYRGLMLDTSRNFYSVDSIMKILRSMAASKFNVLHWHIVDDESFPMELRHFPTVTQNGAFRKSEVYSVSTIKQIVNYAMKLAIRVVPEFDNPGHTRSVGLDPYFRDAVLCYGDTNDYEVPDAYVINGKPHTSTLDPTNEKTYELLSGVFSDMNDLFPEQMIHLGGDEVDESCFDENPNIQIFMRYHQVSNYSALVVMHITKAR